MKRIYSARLDEGSKQLRTHPRNATPIEANEVDAKPRPRFFAFAAPLIS